MSVSDRCTAALTEILQGSVAKGRWLAVQPPGKACGSHRDAPDEGFYDQGYPPAGYGEEGWEGPGAPPAEPLQAAFWLPYDQDEQLAWLDTVVRLAEWGLDGAGKKPAARDHQPPREQGPGAAHDLAVRVRAVLQAAKRHDDMLCDVVHDGAHARPPHGDDYNQLFGLLLSLETALGFSTSSQAPAD
ncbi:hypothetical protein [Pseudoroseomonas sp. WGS1072]|uniref:hypothetical protein n=1 Tax=Roseomonas sp. WGS1072 TaxID=3366816 RepID=UPI003BF200C2